MIQFIPTFGDKLASKLFKREVISETDCESFRETGHSQNAEAYLARYFVIHTNEGPKKTWHVYLHHILKSDPDREMHDHPWDFYSLILWGGYWEETYIPGEFDLEAHNITSADNISEWKVDKRTKIVKISDGTLKMRKWYGPLNFLRRPAEWSHRLYLEKPAWTLVYTKKKRREWGFHSIWGWIHSRNFLNYKCNGVIVDKDNLLRTSERKQHRSVNHPTT